MLYKKIERYGWRKDSLDKRDFVFRPEVKASPMLVDLSPHSPLIFDQGQLGSCTANAISMAIAYGLSIQKKAIMLGSRLFIYWGERAIEGTVGSDSGAEIRDGIKFVNAKGVCPESLWPYDVNKFTVEAPHQDWGSATQYLVEQYLSVNQTLNDMKACLTAGFPFVFGISVYDSFESDAVAQSGNVPLPNVNNEQLLGGHALLCVGYNDGPDVTQNGYVWPSQTFKFQNSWADSWGQKGFATIPYAYLTDPNLGSDYWTIRLVK